MIRPLLAYGPAVFWAAVLLLLGGRTDFHATALPVYVDKVAHFLLYAILGALAAWGWHRAGRRPAGIWPALAVLLVAACDEVHQRSVPGRTADVADWAADALGSAIAFIGASRAIRRRRQTPELRELGEGHEP